MVWDDKVKKLKGILVLVLLLTLLVSPVAALASDETGAKFYGLIQVSNNGTAVTNVSTTCNISTTNLIDGGYLNSSANNCAIQSSSGADLPFQPSVNASYPWALWVPAMGANSIKTDILYTANTTGGKIRYFPGAIGMSTTDDPSMELGDNFTITQSGWWDTSYSVNKSAVLKPAAFKTFINATESITSALLPYPCLSYTTDDFCKKEAGVVAPAGAILSIEAWFYLDALSGDHGGIVACGDTVADSLWQLSKNAAGKLGFIIGNVGGGGKASTWTSTDVFSAGVWHFVTATYDANATPEAVVYMDGEEIGGADGGDGTNIFQPNTFMTIGARRRAAVYEAFWEGDISEIRVSDSVRSLADHIAIYNTGVGIPFTVDGNSVSLWHFDEGVGNPADEVGNNNLIIDGAAWVETSPVLPTSVTATGIASGEHVVRTSANLTHLRIFVDDMVTPKDTTILAANVTPNADDWTFLENNVMPYMEYHTVSVNGTQVQYIDWEYDTTFSDNSTFDNDATPSFRSASSDADVSAEFISFLPISEAKAPAYVLEEAVDFFDADALSGNVTGGAGEFATTPPAGTFPLAGVIAAVATATGTPPQLPLVIIAFFTIIALSLFVSSTMRKYGSGTVFVKLIVIAAMMGVFSGLGNFGVSFWMIFIFLIMGVALAMGSRHVSWG